MNKYSKDAHLQPYKSPVVPKVPHNTNCTPRKCGDDMPMPPVDSGALTARSIMPVIPTPAIPVDKNPNKRKLGRCSPPSIYLTIMSVCFGFMLVSCL